MEWKGMPVPVVRENRDAKNSSLVKFSITYSWPGNDEIRILGEFYFITPANPFVGNWKFVF